MKARQITIRKEIDFCNEGNLCLNHKEWANLCVSSSKEGFLCTREEGHKGVHIACSGRLHNVKRWP